jgi:hypothetical protein
MHTAHRWIAVAFTAVASLAAAWPARAASAAGPLPADSRGVLLSARSTATPPTSPRSDARMKLRARLEVQPGELIEIYEPARGRLVVSQVVTTDLTPLIGEDQVRDIPIADLWKRFAGDAAPRAMTCTTATASASGTRRTRRHSDARRVTAQVCPATGSVTLRLRWDDGPMQSYTVKKNTRRFIYVSDNDCATGGADTDCPYVRADVLDATGDRFHFEFKMVE